MKFDVFGKMISVERSCDKWEVFYLGNEGKKRIAKDIDIPPEMEEKDIELYIDDLCHEWASPSFPKVIKLD